VVSWLTPHKMGPKAILYAFEIAAKMSLQLVAVCAAAGIIVGVIALTGIGTRFSSLLLGLWRTRASLLALFFAMCVSIVLGMGMPTTAAYAVAASRHRAGADPAGHPAADRALLHLLLRGDVGDHPAGGAGRLCRGGDRGSDPMKTSVESFKIGLAAFVVPFMFFYSSALLMQGEWLEILHVFVTATLRDLPVCLGGAGLVLRASRTSQSKCWVKPATRSVSRNAR
jgi:TRAP-type uncharacterized transport system fused permease subunit